MAINRQRLLRTFLDLVRIDSPFGEEEAVAQELTKRLQALKLKVQRDAYGNLIASEEGDRPLGLSAHMDTVQPGRGVKPVIEGNRIRSDGATILGGDCKAGITAILEALASIREDGLAHVPIQVVFTRQEEIGLVGAKNLDFSLVRAREGVIFDGNGAVNRVTVASPTYISVDVRIKGRAAHAGVEPEKGLSAIHIAAEIINELPQGRLDPETTFNIGTIQGGSVRNAVPEDAIIAGEFRSHNTETLELLRHLVHEAVADARRHYPEAVIHEALREEFQRYALGADDSMVQRVSRVLRRLGREPVLGASGGGTDANVFNQHGLRCVVMGMASREIHTVREYVEIPELEDAARFCQALLTDPEVLRP